jgi:hypothetical protein
MAIEAPLNLEGLTKEDGYWRVTGINWDSVRAGYIRVILSGYASEEAYIEGMREIETEIIYVSVDNAEMRALFNTCRTSAYANAKQLDRFTDAKDV